MKKMEKLNKTFLFGAGAVMDWGGPLTSQLTDLVRNTGFTIKNSSQKLTDYIYQNLLKNGYDDSEINFETIINVIEELAIYFSEFNKKKQTPSLLRSFVTGDEIRQVFDFSIKGGQRRHGYTLEIPEGQEYEFSDHALNDENPIQFYLQHLLSEVLSVISAQISKYSYHTNNHSVIDTNSINSRNFVKWISGFETENSLRLYTLNYDGVFKVLMESAKINCFDGFYSTGEVSDLDGLRCDIKKIIDDKSSNVHYNLHGSAFWEVKSTNMYHLPCPEIVYNGIPNLPDNHEIANLQLEKGKPIYLTNIITGYQKAQKSLISPIKQMHFSFDRDCMTTDQIYIIGYSFKDEHINQCLKTALRYNSELKIEIVDPHFIKNGMDSELCLDLFQYFENPNEINPKKISENEFSYYNGRVKVYSLKFHEYLKMKVKANERM